MPAPITVPNRDVQEAFRLETRSWFADILPDDLREDLRKMLLCADAHGLERAFNERLLSNAALCGRRFGEPFWHALLLALFLPETLPEGQAQRDRFTLQVRDAGSPNAAVIGVACARSQDALAGCAQTALEQAAKEKPDAHNPCGNGRLLHWGMAFGKGACKMACKMAVGQAQAS